MHENWVDEVLAFWFDELVEKDWFVARPEVDRAIRERFGALHAELSRRIPDEARTDPRAALAAIVVLDQFSRNLHRGEGGAFVADALALDLARNALDRGFDDALSDREAQFLYMPFMHSEILADQERCLALFKARGNSENVRSAAEHRDIIAKFGRFPHRNRALGRENTPGETTFLSGHRGFGQ